MAEEIRESPAAAVPGRDPPDALHLCSTGGRTVTKGFNGEYHHALDTKGRLIVPARFRDILGSTFMIGVSLDPCLTIYPQEEWEAFYGKLAALPQNTAEVRKLVRYFTAGTFDVELDKQGRILLPAQLRARAGIVKDVVFIGFGRKAELWSEEVYASYLSGDSREEIGDIAAKMLGEGFEI